MIEKDYIVAEDGKLTEASELPPTDSTEDAGVAENASSNESTEGEEEHHESDDSNIPVEASDDEREEIRARRRQERKDKKEAAKERDIQQRREKEMLRKENEGLQQRLAILERRAVGSEFAQLDSAIEQTQRASQYIKEQIRLATEAGDGGTVAEATQKLFQAEQHALHLHNIKRQAVNQSRQTETHSPIDPTLRMHAEKWMDRHGWYDPSGHDPDSRVALTVDQTMAEEGWNPQQSEYWSELDSRLKRYLPHRYQQGTTAHQPTRSPVTNSGREGVNPNNGGSWKLSAERVAAIKEAGSWDDPAKRDKMIKNYRAYDKAQK